MPAFNGTGPSRRGSGTGGGRGIYRSNSSFYGTYAARRGPWRPSFGQGGSNRSRWFRGGAGPEWGPGRGFRPGRV